MAIHLQQLIEEAQELSPHEQIELINAVSHLLRQSYHQAVLTTDFWQPKSIEQLIQAQATQPVQDSTHLVFDEESAGESADDMIAYVYGQRAVDRLRAP